MSLNTSKSISKVMYNNVEIPLSGGVAKNITIDLTNLLPSSTDFPSDFFDNYFITIGYINGEGESTELELDESYLINTKTLEISNDTVTISSDCPNIGFTTYISTMTVDKLFYNSNYEIYTANFSIDENLYFYYFDSSITIESASITFSSTINYNSISYTDITDGSYITTSPQDINKLAIKNSIIRI